MAGFLGAKHGLGKRRRGRRGRRQSIVRDTRWAAHFRPLRFEPMEERTLLSAGMQFDHVVVTQGPGNEVASFLPAGSSLPPTSAFNPAQIKQAYGIDQVKIGGVLQDGTGETIAIIDAYDNPMFVSRNGNSDVNQDPNFLASDLHQFDVQYGLPEPAGFFTKVDQTGGTNYPSGDTNWGTEIALDVEWVHALAPGAKIILIEANSSYGSDLLDAAAVWARDHSGAQVVTMSFGGNESSGDPTTNSIFQSPADHNITWLASTGDDGVPGGYPALSPNVVAVGGTTLTAPGGVYGSESGWNGSGGGISSYEAEPSYQQGLVIQSGTSVINQNGKRTIPDVVFDADLNSGVAVYDSYSQGSTYPWLQVGGTSFSSPAWAAMIGITDEMRANHGLPSLDGLSGTLPALYQIYNDPGRYASDFHDITTGSNGDSAATGYDLVTGIGTPKANLLLPDLAGVNIPPTVTGTTPSLSGGTLATGTTTLNINFNRTVLGGDVAANYALQSVGPDGLLGTADDAIVPLSASYSADTATLTFPALAENIYRLTVRDAITDQAGNPLDGNGDGIPGGNWTGDFVVISSNPSQAPVVLSSPHGLPFDVSIDDFGAGDLVQGYDNAFDGDGRLIVDGTPYQPGNPGYSLNNDNQTVVTAADTLAGLTVTRQVTVPNTGTQDFARTVDVFTNSTATPITTSVTIVGNLGSDAATNVFATSDGTGVVSANDQWIGTDDAGDGSGTPAVIHYVHGPASLLTPVSASLIGDNLQWTYSLTVPAGQTVRLAYFTIVATTRAVAIVAANALVTPSGFGGQAAAFLSPVELQSLVNYTSTNNAPVLIPAEPQGTTDEDTPLTVGLSGTFINNGPGTTTITDPDPGAIVGGIAVVGTTGNGTWSYSLDGSTFYPIGAVSTTAALLLPNTAQLCYTPDMMNGETVTITYRAWDTTYANYGVAGTKVDSTINGGTTAFSTATDTASLVVADVNDAPVLTPAAPSLGLTNQAIPVTIPLTGTFINHGAGTTTVSDVDNGAIVGGIAVVGTTGLNGWSYSLDGVNFSPVGTVSPAGALLLPSTAALRYQPDGVDSETPTITYCAWDMTSGVAGAYTDTSNNGGTTAFSSATDTASLTIDYTPPSVTATTPALTGGTLTVGAATLAVKFSEAVIGGGTAANYELKSVGPDGLLGTADDAIVPLTVSCTGTTATLTFSPLPESIYRLTVHDTITDVAGNRLDGNGDGAAGGDWCIDFVVVPGKNAVFASPLATLSTTNPYSVAVGDFNGDGHADLAVANYFSTTVTVFRGDGKGGFTSVGSFYDGGSSPRTVAVGDLNRDGKLDLILANYGSNTVTTLLGAGDGTFALCASASTGGSGTQGLAVGDFNGDGKLDVATTNWSTNTVTVLLGNGSGGFSSTSTLTSGGSWPDAIATADFNGDGKLDLAVANGASNNVGVLLGNGSGGFSAATTISSDGFWPQGIAVGDLNGDGRPDIAVTNASSNTVGVLWNYSNGFFNSPATIVTGASPMGVAIADFNGDGNNDLAVADNNDNGVTVFLNNGKGSFAAGVLCASGGTGPQGVAAADFNGDGKPDLAVANANSNAVGILPNISGTAPVTLASPHNLPFDVAVGSFGAGELVQGYNNAFDGDGRLMVGGALFPSSTVSYATADSGQSVATASGTLAGLTVSRKVTVPNSGSDDFARTIDSFTNSTASTISTTVTIVGNLGSDGATHVFATSDGTGIVSPNDQWIGTDDASDGSGTPAVIHYLYGLQGQMPASVAIVGDNIEWSYNLVVYPGQTVRLGYFTIVAATQAAAVASANALVTPTGFGGQAAAFLSPAELQSLVNFTTANQAPVLTPASPSMGTTNEDNAATIGLSGTFINNGPGTTTITDADPGAVLGGIAVVGAIGCGTWSYSLDGSTFHPVGAVNDGSALLLPSTATLRYTPDMMNGETATITYRAWDATYGTPGTTAGTTINGGTTAFSSATDTASLVVTDVNDAPVLTPASPSLGVASVVVPVTLPLSGTFINHGTGTTAITDVDHGALVGGIAVEAITGYGTWSYSLDGTTFNPVGSVSASSALLLPGTAQLRYTPGATGGERPTITYCAWDATAGTPGTLADATTNGSTTAFSLATDTASLLIQDAPVLTPASPSMGTTTEDGGIYIHLAGTFINNGPGTTTISDVDSGAIVGGIALVGTTGHGTWYYSLNGTTFIPVNVVSPTAALLLPKTAELWYATDQKNGEAATITYRAWDTTTGSAGSNVDTSSNGGTTAFSAATDTATLTVTDVNDAPVLTAASPSLGLTNQTTPVTIPLSGTFISHGSGTTTSTDVDNGAVVGGIALQGTTGRNAWSYSLDGTTFSPVGTVSGTSALLLPNTAQLRYAADGIHSETATITYRAWDTTSGTAGSKVYPSNIGGSTAFSSVTDVASLTIDYTAPRVSITTPVLTGGTLDAGTSALAITFSEAVTGGGTAANYQLQSAGPDGLLGTADDVIVPLTVSYSGTMATLGFPALPGDVYRLTVHDTLTDAAGNKLDGNGDGHAGGDWVTDFVLVPTSFIGPPTTVTSSNALSVAVGDFNGDGHADLAVVGSFFGVGGIFLGDGKGGFSSDGTFNTGGQDPVTVAAADLNRDGRLDLIAVNYVSNTVSVLLGSGNGTFGTATTFSSGGTDPQCLAVADFNGDGKLDVAITNWASNTVGILLGDGGGGLGNVATFSTGGGWPYAITAADFNGDGALDLAVANRGSANVGILLGNGAGSFGTATSFSSGGSQPQGIAVGDFNGDGKMDVVVSNNTSNTVGILLGNGTGALGAVTTFGSGQTKPMGMAVADFNGDGHADIAVANAGGLVGILVGNGAGSFAAASTLFSGGSNPQGVAIGDFNGDGRPDLAMPSSSSGVVGILLNTDDLAPATFTSPHGLNFDVALVV